MEPSQEDHIPIDVEPFSGAFRRSGLERLRLEARGQYVDAVRREATGFEPTSVQFGGQDDGLDPAEGPPSEQRIVECALHPRAGRRRRLGHSVVEGVDHWG